MSTRIVVQQYLAEMRERNELDLLLPELLAAMGHHVISAPQIGVRQSGVDCMSTVKRARATEVYLFVIKFGDIGRDGFYVGKQAIDPSVREVCNNYLRTRLPAHLTNAQRHIAIVTNGVLKQEVQEDYASLSKFVEENAKCDLTMWNESALVSMIEDNLFNERLLLEGGQSHLRKAIAGLDDPDFAFHHMRKFIDAALDVGKPPVKKATLHRARFFKRCSSALMGWVVFESWCRSENNLKPALRAAEYLQLTMWCRALAEGVEEAPHFQRRMQLIVNVFLNLATAYYEKVGHQLLNARALLRYRPDRPQYTDLVFDEVGRLGLLLHMLHGVEELAEVRRGAAAFLVRLLEEHPGCRLPFYDGHSIDLSLAFSALLHESAGTAVARFLEDALNRVEVALNLDRHLPIDTDSLEDAYALYFHDAKPKDFFETSSFVPMAATVAAALGAEPLLAFLNERLLPLLEEVTLERWFPSGPLETSWEKKTGISRCMMEFGKTCANEIEKSLTIPPGASKPEDFRCVQTGDSWLIAMSARHFRHPLPTWLIVNKPDTAET